MPEMGPQGCRFARWVLIILFIACALPSDAIGQSRGRGRGRLPGGEPSGTDPTDPAKRDAARARKAQRYLEQGRQLLAKGRVQRAKVKFKSVIEMMGADPLGQAAFSELSKIHDQGMQALGAARLLYQDGDYRNALDQAKQCRAQYANIWSRIEGAGNAPNVARLAVRLIKTIEADPKAKIAFQEHEASKRARKIPRLEKQAKKDAKRYFDLYKLLKTVSGRFPDCPTGKQCEARLAKLKADKKIWKVIRREERRRFIASALRKVDWLRKEGRKAEAAAEYKKLARKYPGKSEAELRKIARK